MSKMTSVLDGFVVRRVHSLLGVVPIGLFLIVHLTTNSSVVWGAMNGRASADSAVGRGVETFQHEVHFINNLPFVLLMEIFVLWIPIAVHAGLGAYYAMSGKRNVHSYAYTANWRYSLMRATAWIGLVFVVYHVGTLRWGWNFLTPADSAWNHYYASSTLAAALKGTGGEWTYVGVLISLGYFLGVTSLVFHFANGLWTAAITWGLTVTRKAQKRFGFICAALGIGLMGAGWSALGGFVFLVDHSEAQQIEERLVLEMYGAEKLEELREKYGIEPDEHASPGEVRAYQEAVRDLATRPYPGAAEVLRRRESPTDAGADGPDGADGEKDPA